MDVAHLYKAPKNWPVLSAETCPIPNHSATEPVLAAVEKLSACGIRVIAANAGATGRSRGDTVSLCRVIRERFEIPTVAPLSIRGMSRRDLESLLCDMHRDALHNVFVMGGGSPPDRIDSGPSERGQRHPWDLVEQIAHMNRGRWLDGSGDYARNGIETNFGVGIAGFPEVHPDDCASTGDSETGMDRQLRSLKKEIEAGADYVIEQAIFDADLHFNFVAKARAAGIQVPIVPGILAFERLDQVEHLLGGRSCISMPADLTGALRGLSVEDQAEVATEYLSGQVRTLLEAGVPGIHFYCMNRAEPTVGILERARG